LVKHKEEIEVIKQDVQDNIPKIAESAAEKVEITWTKRLQAELRVVRARYESEIEGLKKEIMELNASFSEKDARRRVQMAEEKAELVL
jgi:prefoldin subunit 5